MRTEPFGEPARSRYGRLSLKDKTDLKQALLAIELMSDRARRDIVLRELREEVGADFDPSRFPATGPDVWEIVTTCVRLGAMAELVGVLKLLGGDTREWKAFAQLAEQLFPRTVLNAADRLQVEPLFRDIPAEVVTRALSDAQAATNTDLGLESAGAYPDVLREVEHVVATRCHDRKPLWIFLESVAHGSGDVVYEELHRAISAAARMVGLADYAAVAGICSGFTKPETGAEPAADPADELNGTTDPVRSEAGEEYEDSGDDVDTGAPAGLRSGRKPSSTPAIWGGVPPRNPFFTGRLDLLDKLRHTLRPSVRATVLPSALHGLGGIGKTQIAVEFAYRFRSDYDLIWWVAAGDDRSIRRSLVSLGRKLGLSEGEDQQFLIDSMLDELRLGRDHPRWLLIFDNAVDPEVVKPYLPGGSGHVMLTSRDRGWISASAVVEVDVFAPEESVEFLLRRWTDMEPEGAQRLADKLGHLPLALDQAVAVHEQSGMPLEQYLDLLDRSPVQLLDQTTAARYPEPIARTWKIAFDRLQERSPAAAQLLQLCAFLSPQPISSPMLREGRGADLPPPLSETLRDELQFRRAVQDISKYALAQLDSARDFITLHMLVSTVLRGVLPEEKRAEIRRQAHELLALANPGSPDRSDTWVRHARISPHVIDAGLVGSSDTQVLQVVIDQIRYFFAIGDFAQSETLARLAVSDWEVRIGPDHLSTLRAQFHLGNALRVLGSYAEARSITEKTMEQFRQKYGSDHEFTLQVANSLTSDLRLSGDFAKALTLDQENLEKHRAVLGHDDPGTLRAANNLALDYRLAGEFTKAYELDRDNVQRRDVVDPGGSNAGTLLSINNLVRDMYGRGEYVDALKLQEERLQWFETRLRANHRMVLMGRRNMAILWRRLGNYPLALGQAEADAETCLNHLGPAHEHTLAAQVTLFNTLRAAGHDLVRARALASDTWSGYRDRFGDEHPATLACAVDVAIVMRAQGDHEKAREIGDLAHAGLVTRLGPDHQYTLCAAANRANDAAVLDGPDRARELSADALQRSRRVRGPDHPYTLAAAANHALDLASVGEHEEAFRLRAETLSSLQLRLGPEHPQTISVERGRRTEADIELPPM